MRGTSHIRSREPLQDTAHAWCGGENASTLIGVVSDGAGSAKFGKAGSSLACRIFLTEIASYIRCQDCLPADDKIFDVLDKTRDTIFSASYRRGLSMRDFACTFVGVIADRERVITVHVGDGAVVGKKIDGTLVTLSAPDHGEYASTTYFLTDDNFGGDKLRVKRHEGDYCSLALMSDGLERLALSMSNNAPFEPFFRGIFKPLQDSVSSGYDSALSARLREYLGSEQVNSRTDDDKSLVIAHRI